MLNLIPPFNQGPFVSADPPENVRADPFSGFLFAHAVQNLGGHAHIFAGVGSSFDIPLGAGGTVRAHADPVFDWFLTVFNWFYFGGGAGSLGCTLFLATGRDGWTSNSVTLDEASVFGGGANPTASIPGGITTMRSRADGDTPDWGAAFLVVEADAGAWGTAHAEANIQTFVDLMSVDFF